MKLVIDANILFSALIREGKTAEILLNLFCDTYTPSFIFEEFENHYLEILRKTERSEEEIMDLLGYIKQLIKIIPTTYFEEEVETAKKISPDINDALYFALALKLNCPIWSNDKRLKEQKYIQIYSTEDLVEYLNSQE
jgi:predicted nucleic acid-binding protein